MKANEAPEKIYLFENPINNEPDYRWLSKRSGNEDIEYIRTDAFIKRAKESSLPNIDLTKDKLKELSNTEKYKKL